MVAGHGALLPDRPLLPRRGLPRRPAAGVHPARHRDELRRPGRRDRAGRGGRRRAVVGAGRLRDPAADPAADLRRGDGPLRLGQAGPAVRRSSSPSSPSTSPTPRSGCSRRPYVGAVVMPGGASQPRRQFDAWQEWAQQRGARGLAYVTVGDDGTLGGPVAKNLSDAERDGLAKATGAEPGDAIFFAAGHPADARALLGAARGEIARRCGLVDESAWSFVWVVDAPMFERIRDDEGNELGWTAVHHPFTSPNARVDRPVRGRPGARAGLRLRHRLQRQRDRRRVDPYPPLRRAAAGVRAARDGRGASSARSSGSCSTRSSTGRRRTAASPSAGTAPACCSPAPTRCAR